ncbi:MAG: cysteine--tRNA ligase [Cytophagales bacterium]|nr:cysteine--tRNA ligase [Cytophagales bacterium]
MLTVYNTLTRKKEPFQPLHAPHVGMYVCGPTVYGDAHLGHARSAVTFDIVYRYLLHLGYKVRYVRNITDVGHLENDADEGEDKIAKKARLDRVEPMEIAYKYMNAYHNDIGLLNVRRPNIEPLASGHIPEQIQMIQSIIQKGYGYEVNGSVYFDVNKYSKESNYGTLSGRKVDDLLENTRDLDGQEEKRSSMDFALWKNAGSNHIMRWNSPWGEGFPGWHIECSAMSKKYLGEHFDIHGGGMDLLFPHHEAEIAQSNACCGQHKDSPAKYWLHNNMITINGQKMGKSLGNFITLQEFYTGANVNLEQAYSPMTIRFYILQAQYRSTLDVSNSSLKAAQIAYRKLLNTAIVSNKLLYPTEAGTLDDKLESDILKTVQACTDGMDDDFNTGIVIGHLFTLSGWINSFFLGQKNVSSISISTFELLKSTYQVFFYEILGLKEENPADGKQLINGLLEFYTEAKQNKEYNKVDKVRSLLKSQGIAVKDQKTGVDWAYDV